MQKIASPEHLTRELRDVLSYAQTRHPERQRIASQLVALAERVSSVRLSSRGTPLYGHDSEQTAYNVDDYPYSFKLRCKIRYWLEMKPNKGFRFVSQTENPKTGRWNKPKASTYADIGGCMYLDSQQHVQWAALGSTTREAEIVEFLKDFPRADVRILREFARAKLKYLDKAAAGQVVWSINGEPKPNSEEDIGRWRAELEQWQDIAKLIH